MPSAETRLHYYRARYYDPFSGRFASEDPIRFWGGANFYRYANNEPIRYADPFGTFPGPLCLYYIYKCAKTAQQCRLALDKASGGPYNPNGDTALCQGTHSKDADEAYHKTCVDGNYYCQKMQASCGQDAVEPPFANVSAGSGPPGNIGPKPDPPTPTKFPPNYPGNPLPHVY